jgi:hypothetical protein
MLGRWEDESVEFVLLGVDGTEVASIDDVSGDMQLFAGSGGTILTENRPGGGGSSVLLSADGQRRDPIPGLADNEWVAEAVSSPDGSVLALSVAVSATEVPVVRIVEAATGVEITEIAEPERQVWPMAWSTDGRFLFCERAISDTSSSPTGDNDQQPPVDWAVYDIETGAAQRISLPAGRWVGEIRMSEAAPPAEDLTPVDWGINIDDAGSGVHLVHMIVEARPLAPGQVDGVSGRLVWDETVVDLCRIEIREVGVGFVHVGDIFGTDEGCGSNPTAMQDAFDEFGLPETACVTVRADGVDHEFCAPMS